MPHYGWAGPGEMRQIDLPRAKAPDLQEPSSPSPEGAKRPETRHICKVCDRKFKKAMILARHFNSAHSDLREDKDSWREHAEKVEV